MIDIKEAYDFTWDMIGIIMNCAMIFAIVILIVGLMVVIYNLIKMIKE